MVAVNCWQPDAERPGRILTGGVVDQFSYSGSFALSLWNSSSRQLNPALRRDHRSASLWLSRNSSNCSSVPRYCCVMIATESPIISMSILCFALKKQRNSSRLALSDVDNRRIMRSTTASARVCLVIQALTCAITIRRQSCVEYSLAINANSIRQLSGDTPRMN